MSLCINVWFRLPVNTIGKIETVTANQHLTHQAISLNMWFSDSLCLSMRMRITVNTIGKGNSQSF